jgi:hypothetical protein
MTGDSSPGPTRFTLDVRALPDRIVTVRVFVGAVARQLGCSDKDAEDARLAASEACSQAIVDDDNSSGTLSVAADRAGDAVRFTISRRPSQRATGPRPQGSQEARAPDAVPDHLDVVRALFPETQVAVDAGTTAISFRVPVSPQIRF